MLGMGLSFPLAQTILREIYVFLLQEASFKVHVGDFHPLTYKLSQSLYG